MSKSGFDLSGLKGLDKKIKKSAVEHVKNKAFDFKCPECGSTFKVKVGENTCPNCGFNIEFKPDSSWRKL